MHITELKSRQLCADHCPSLQGGSVCRSSGGIGRVPCDDDHLFQIARLLSGDADETGCRSPQPISEERQQSVEQREQRRDPVPLPQQGQDLSQLTSRGGKPMIEDLGPCNAAV